MFERHISPKLLQAAAKNPVVTLTGPRQSGKTTLVRKLFPKHRYQSLESPDLRARAEEDPRAFLAQADAMILDEIQRAPELLSYIQGMVDDNPQPGRFILTGSQNLLLMQSVSQTLAGRSARLLLPPLSLAELHGHAPLDVRGLEQVGGGSAPTKGLWQTLWEGFYPRIHDQALNPRTWLADYLRTYVERDLREILQVSNLRSFETFIRLCAARTAQELNFANLANDAGVSRQTAQRWISVLEMGFLLTVIPPHQASYRKRLRKRPRLHFLDTGLLCYLLGIYEAAVLEVHPLRGAIFESFVAAELYKGFALLREDPPLFFWRDSTGHEVDLLIELGTKILPVEVKSGQTFAAEAVSTLNWWTSIPSNPNRGGVLVYGGDKSFDFKGVRVLPWFLR